MHAMWGVWAPPIERSKMVSFTYAGSQFGTIIAQPISGILCASNFLGGWPSVFYVFGKVAIISLQHFSGMLCYHLWPGH